MLTDQRSFDRSLLTKRGGIGIGPRPTEGTGGGNRAKRDMSISDVSHRLCRPFGPIDQARKISDHRETEEHKGFEVRPGISCLQENF